MGLRALAQGSGCGLALAPGQLLGGSRELVGRGGRHGAVLGGRAALSAELVLCSDGLLLTVALVQGTGLPWRRDGGYVNPGEVWLGAVSCFVF